MRLAAGLFGLCVWTLILGASCSKSTTAQVVVPVDLAPMWTHTWDGQSHTEAPAFFPVRCGPRCPKEL